MIQKNIKFFINFIFCLFSIIKREAQRNVPTISLEEATFKFEGFFVMINKLNVIFLIIF
jgi:hypothetical protein